MVSIILVNYKTKNITKACIEAIGGHTQYPHEIIVVDNNSADDSLEYLNDLPDIKLIACKHVPEEVGEAHAEALDAGLFIASTKSKYALIIHSDTIVKKDGWLKEIVNRIRVVPKGALLAARSSRTWHLSDEKYYPGTDLMLLDLEAVRKTGAHFSPARDGLVGKSVLTALGKAGYVGVWITHGEKRQLADHLLHATWMVAREQLALGRGSKHPERPKRTGRPCGPCAKRAAEKKARGEAYVTNVKFFNEE